MANFKAFQERCCYICWFINVGACSAKNAFTPKQWYFLRYCHESVMNTSI